MFSLSDVRKATSSPFWNSVHLRMLESPAGEESFPSDLVKSGSEPPDTGRKSSVSLIFCCCFKVDRKTRDDGPKAQMTIGTPQKHEHW